MDAKMFSSFSVIAYLFIAVVFITDGVNSSKRPIKVVTSVGDFVGTIRDVNFGAERKAVKEFLGIPFAKPPVGELRFAPSVSVDRHDYLYNATYYRPHCMQREDANKLLKYFTVSEDCLYLNIFIPGNYSSDNKRYDVMIWIYGGGFSYGGADMYSGDVFSAFNDVVVVTFNYRVNVFGFLRTDHASAPGNAGLLDQRLAIKWVKDNIAPFGGNPDRITLFGESAGAASVIYQGLFKINQGLFNRIIAQSGSPLAIWAFQDKPQTNFEEFVNRTNCTSEETISILDCLRRMPAAEILSKLKPLDMFLPAIDNVLIKEPPQKLFANTSRHGREAMEAFSNLDFLSGVNDQEGASIVSGYWAKRMKKLFIDVNSGVPKFYFDMIYLPAIMETLRSKNTESGAVFKSVMHQYTNWLEPYDKIKVRKNMVDLTSDIYFIVPAVQTANKHSERKSLKSTYFYEFKHRSALSKQPEWIKGASHTMELPFVFGFPSSLVRVAGISEETEVEFPETEIELGRHVMKLWTNFAKSGNPNSGSSREPLWPQYDSTGQVYLQISSNVTKESVKQRLAASRVHFWTEVVPFLQECSKVECQNCTNVMVAQSTAASNSFLCNILLLFCNVCYIFYLRFDD